MMLFLLELPVFLLIAGKGKIQLIISLAAFLLLVIGLNVLRRKNGAPFQIGITYPLLSLAVDLVLAGLFFGRWGLSQRMASVAGILGMMPKQSCLFIAFFLALLALPGIGVILRTAADLFSGKRSGKDQRVLSGTDHEDTVCCQERPALIILAAFIGFTALLMLFLNSRSSPFYAIDDWVDPNTMFTVGKGILKGYVPYRDLYEQKGPMLVFIHTIGAFFSFDTLHGVWALQVISGAFLLFLIYKISSLFLGRKSILIVPLFAAVLYSSQTFGAGDTAEEFSLPFLTYAIYVGCKALLREKLPSKREFLFIGITSGFVFWIKYSIVGLYIGWFLYFLIFSVSRRKLPCLIKGIGLIITGVFLSSLPVLLYFLSQSALDSLFQAYFYNNLFYYADQTSSFFLKMQFGLNYYWIHASFPLILSLAGLLWIGFRRNWRLFSFVFLTYIAAVVFLYIGGMIHGYSSLPLCVFSVFGFICLMDLPGTAGSIQRLLSSHTEAFSAISLITGLLLLCGLSQNQRFLEYEKENWFQYKMKAVIEESGAENPSVLYYHMGDAGVNTVAGLIPGIRFFCYYHNPKLAEIEEVQNRCIRDRCVDYIIAQNRFQDVHPEFESYEYRGSFPGIAEDNYSYYHYYVPAGSSR